METTNERDATQTERRATVTYQDVAAGAVAHDLTQAVAYIRQRAGELVAAYGPSVQGAVLDIADELEELEHVR